MGRLRSGSIPCLLLLVAGCHSEAPPSAPSASNAPSAPSAAAMKTAPASASASAAQVAAASAPAPAADERAAAAASDGSVEHENEKPRNVKYFVNPDGMRVEVDGVAFTPKAEAVKSGAGYSIKIKVSVRAKDGATHSLLAPVGSEVAIAGSVTRAGSSEAEKFGDQRSGDRELTIKGEKPVTVVRTWPAKDGLKPLGAGDEAQLMVGIWGIGVDAATRRPLKKFCKITVKFDKAKPRVVIAAPEGVSR